MDIENCGIMKMLDWSKSQRSRLSEMEKARIEILVSGKLRITHFIDGKPELKIYGDLPAAIRSQDYIIENYLGGGFKLGEINVVREIENELALIRTMLTSWQFGASEQAKKADLNLTKAKESLARVRNKYKKATREQLIHMAGFRDCLNRINPGAMAARSTAGMSMIGKRRVQINSNAALAAKRKLLLLDEKSQIEINLTAALAKMKYFNTYYFDIIRASDYVRRLINDIQYFLVSIWVLPHSKNISSINKLLTSIIAYKQARKKEKLKQAILLLEQSINLGNEDRREPMDRPS